MDTGRCVKNRKINKIRKEVTEPQEYSYSEKTCNSHREVGDGAPAENETEKPELMLMNEMNHSPSRIYLQLEIDVIAIGLLILALCTRLYKLDEPRHIVFDELHYGRYVSLYTKGVFFFDAHPPLGKQLLYLAGSIAGYDGNFTFDRIGTPYTDNVPVKALRLVPAVSGSFLVLITYFLMLELSLHQWTAILAALLVLLENCFLAQSRFMLLESIQILFGLCGVYCIIKSTKRIGLTALVWLCAAAVLLGCCFSVKYSGLYTYYLSLFLVGRHIWLQLNQIKSGTRLLFSALWRFAVLLIIPLAVYVSVFYMHLSMLPKAGPHDSVMTSAFQASLQGGLASITHGQPLHVAHGSQITLRHTHGRTCWLHSHAHVYPVRYADGRGSSHQQQVTCYSFKDVNNWWIVKRPDQASLAVSRPPDAIRHGDIVQLLHGITSRALNSHDVAAAVSPQSQEVSCYIDYNVSMPAQNLWRVDIVNRDSEESTWDSIRSLVRLVHVDTGSGLRYSGRQLPAWGFHQHEIVADKVLSHQDTIWNVEEHRYTKADDRKERERELVTAEMIPTAVTQLTFWEKFTELQYKMIAHAPDAPHGHMFASEPAEWPLLVRSIAYWLSPDSNAQIHLIGNIVTWYTGTISVIVYSALLAIYSVRKRRACEDLPPFVLNKFYETGYTLFLGYWLHYLPYFFIDRTLFLHHYLPAYIFKILLLAYIVDHIYLVLQLHEKTRHVTNLFILCVTIWLSYIVLTFKKFSVLNYGNVDLKENDLMSLRWKDTWDFILHKKI
ncbi:protein O-mannosyltransferase 1 isoform X1 [Bombyx mandarina]|uniref:Protein O-mannosyltransferase 1 n=2 Tax=Bombyx mandarina TaxID=7092 RepID=A0A6J2KFB2_BOMMA|nr:protein O-mannosyltransferase 1 isoform X1 [Bombyx mandarina]